MECSTIPACPSSTCFLTKAILKRISSKTYVWCLCVHVRFYHCPWINLVNLTWNAYEKSFEICNLLATGLCNWQVIKIELLTVLLSACLLIVNVTVRFSQLLHNILCRTGARYWRSNFEFGRGSGAMYYSRFNCGGSEDTVSHCSQSPVSCSNNYGITVVCNPGKLSSVSYISGCSFLLYA